MLRSSSIGAAAAVLCGVSFAQQTIDPIPITSPIKQGPTINLATGQRMSKAAAAQQRVTIFNVYDNTCTWTGNPFYTGTGVCETYVDEGIIPGGVGDPTAPAGATSDNLIDAFSIAYCTNFATGTVDIKVAFYDTLGGQCAGAASVSPGLGLPVAPNAYFQLPVAAMPGDAVPGGTGVSCWIVPFQLGNLAFCMQSDADGVWDNAQDQDRFNWAWQMDNVLVSGTAASGIILSGEPSTSPVHGCTYTVACGTDAWGGNPCGHGFGSDDGFWINVDNDPPNNPPTNTGVTCVSAPGPGTTCYWFGGYPGNPFGGFYLTLGSAGSCAGCTGSPTNYCTAGTSSVAAGSCVATMSVTGVPSASNAGTCFVTGNTLPGDKNSLCWFSFGQLAAPFGANGHFICVGSPKQRTTPANSGGTPGVCDGTYSVDINAFIAAQGGQLLGSPIVAGSVVNCQVWFRDQGSGAGAANNVATTDGIQLTFCN
jgi:hypothetical protein